MYNDNILCLQLHSSTLYIMSVLLSHVLYAHGPEDNIFYYITEMCIVTFCSPGLPDLARRVPTCLGYRAWDLPVTGLVLYHLI
jgi:hypothetical protein